MKKIDEKDDRKIQSMLSVNKFRVVIVGRDALRNQCTGKICHKYELRHKQYFFFPEMEKKNNSRLPGAKKV